MKHVFLGIFAALLALSAIAAVWQPGDVSAGRTRLSWTVDESPVRQEQVDLFNRLHPDLLLRIDAANADPAKVIVQSLAGVGADLFCCYNNASLAMFARSGVAMDLTDEIRSWGLDLEQDIWNGANATTTYDGRVYGFPANVAVDCLWYHRDLLAASDVTLPEGPMTWEQFLPIAQTLTLRDANGRVTQFGFGLDWYRWEQYVRQWGGSTYSPQGTRCTLDSPQAIAALQFMFDLVYTHRVSPSPVEEASMASQGGWGGGNINLFGGKRIATTGGGRWWLMSLRQFSGLELGVHEMPHAEHRTFLSYGKSVMINARGRHRAEALRFVRFLSTGEYHELLHDQADGLGPVRSAAFTDRFLFNPAFPSETQNAVWRDAMLHAEPEQTSLFTNSQVVQRLVNEQLDLLKNRLKTPEQAMRDAARNVNEHIRQTLEQDPELRERYLELVRAGAPSVLEETR
jgi:multiple sugar transport system substrate-binding protein